MIDSNRVVVIGSGPSGATATRILVDAGIDVTLLEAGPVRATNGLTACIAGLTVARVHRALNTAADIEVADDTRARVFEDLAPGGLSNHWSCAVPRFSRDDFADARRAGEAFTWPIDYDDLAPWYDRVEPLLRIAGSVADVPPLPAGRVSKALRLPAWWAPLVIKAASSGQALVPVPYAFGGDTTITPSGTRCNAFVRLVKPVQRSSRLTIRYDAHVTRLEWSGAKKRVTGVVYRDAVTGVEHRVACRAVMLAAGAIKSAKILLQSTDADFPDGLGNTDGVLGKYLTDHPLGKVAFDVSTPMPMQPPAYLTRPPLDRSAPLYAAACSQWGGIAMMARSLLSTTPLRLQSCGFNVFGTMAPAERDYVALDSGIKSPDGTAGVRVHLRHPPEAGDALVAARDQMASLLDAVGAHPRMTTWLVEPVGVSVHYAGTCRMHASPRLGMLDAWSRLHAVGNAAVVDAGAFTTHPEKNPALTAMALAARASARVADDIRSGRL